MQKNCLRFHKIMIGCQNNSLCEYLFFILTFSTFNSEFYEGRPVIKGSRQLSYHEFTLLQY